ncbi:MAG: multi-sensor hybrid histidine kinase [Candidatus Magnetoglobus multicellularis str. Araruama]|uniref:histidine kinase n=1 Tax=Candidatus Magnetoglobus multicellularis str. Araruama TaxID=890399 RepID=A0A1V1PBF5_9BACT|nr:MAG: multi-sensor hybrid histidine kinase [Candidatus Magnetoglobus multicellularis str. Araruama]
MLDLIKVKTTKLATQLVLSFFIAMVAPMTIATIFSIVYFSHEIYDHAIQKMQCEGQMARLMYSNALNNLEQMASVYAKRNDTALLLSYSLGQPFQKELHHLMQANQIDMLTVVNLSRKVVIRVHSPSHSKDILAETPYLVQALSGKVSSAVDILSHDHMQKEGFHFPGSVSQSNLIMMTAAAPVHDRKNENIIGAVIVRQNLEPGSQLMQSISDQLKMNIGLYQGISFMGSVLTQNDNIFFPVPETILRQSITHNTPTFDAGLVQDGRISLCLPIENFYDQPVAQIVIQRSASSYIRAQHIAMISHIVILCLAILLGFIFRKRIERRILLPVKQLQNGVKQIRKGDYKHRLSVQGIEEIENLAVTFNEMTIELQDKQEFLTRTEKKYRGIFENAVEGIFQMTPDGRFLDANPAMARILGYASQTELMAEITDLARQSFVVPDDLSEFRHILAEKLQVIDFETQLYQKTGNKIWCSISARAVFDISGEVLIKGDLLYYEGTLLDITNRKERERAERARNAAEMANQAKTDFLARMSHEIRTPMNAILGMAEMLQNSSLTSEQKRYVELFSSSGELLLNIINDILDFSKIEAGQLSIESIEFDLIEIIENTGKTLSFKAHEKALELIIHIAPDTPRYVFGDPVRLQQILINLTGNAVKFTEKGEVILKVSSDRKNANSYIFTIEDTGIGIDRSYHSSIFERFSQADTSITRHYGGTGLGLAISKKLVELMGGKIWFTSEKNKGTAFYFTLSLEAVDRDDPAMMAIQQYIGKNALIIEKSIQSAKALSARLKYWHIYVDSFDSAKAARAHINVITDTSIPDLVFINNRLSDADPFALKEELIGKLPSKTLFIMLFSSDNQTSKKEKALKKGFGAYLCKPIMTSDLDRALDISNHKTVSEKSEILPHKNALLDCNNPLHILVADDHLSNRKVIEMFLKNDPVFIDFAENGELAIEKYQSHSYDMIIMDMEMPVLNGIKATRKIREIEQDQGLTTEIPIIFLTAHALDEHQKQCYDAGGTACLTKPVKYQKLIETIQHYAPTCSLLDAAHDHENKQDETDLSDTNFEMDNADMPDFSDVDIQSSMIELLPFLLNPPKRIFQKCNGLWTITI